MSLSANVGIEGDRHTWWYICEECRGAIDPGDCICKHCNSLLSWKGASLNERANTDDSKNAEKYHEAGYNYQN